MEGGGLTRPVPLSGEGKGQPLGLSSAAERSGPLARLADRSGGVGGREESRLRLCRAARQQLLLGRRRRYCCRPPPPSAAASPQAAGRERDRRDLAELGSVSGLERRRTGLCLGEQEGGRAEASRRERPPALAGALCRCSHGAKGREGGRERRPPGHTGNNGGEEGGGVAAASRSRPSSPARLFSAAAIAASCLAAGTILRQTLRAQKTPGIPAALLGSAAQKHARPPGLPLSLQP